MPAKMSKEQQRRADLLAKVPPSATRVYVETLEGHKKYKYFEDLLDSDTIQTNKMGDPIVMKSKPGRRSVKAATAPANPTIAEILKRKQAAIDKDEILKQAKNSPESPDFLQAIIQGLGEEAASLRFDREEAARKGEKTAALSSKRVQALRATADTWLKRMDQVAGTLIDLDSPVYEALFRHTMDSLHTAAKSARISDEQVRIMFSRLSSIVGSDEWKDEARSVMKKAGK